MNDDNVIMESFLRGHAGVEVQSKTVLAPCHLDGAAVGDVIIAPIDTISTHKRTNALWAVFRGAHKISKKTDKGTNGNTGGLIHRRSYADVAAAPA